MKKVLIVFTDKYLAYSPTTLNMYFNLKNNGLHPTVIAEKPVKHFSPTLFEGENITYLTWKSTENLPPFQKLMRRVKKLVKPENKLLTEKAKSFINEIHKNPAASYIAVDFFALWCLQAAGKKAHLVSLEIYENDVYYRAVNFDLIESVIIQSSARFEYLFNGKTQPPLYLIQNAPPFLDIRADVQKRNRTDLIYCGTCYINFGIISCLEFIKDFPAYTLTVIGAIPPDTQDTIDLFYQDLIVSGHLKIDKNYYELDELTRIISTFRIGLVFYDFYHHLNLRKFNVYTAPSGKLYQYFNSGLPVVGNQLPGFAIVEEKKAGVLIFYLSTLQIKKAIDMIEDDYETFARNAKEISKTMDSKAAMENFINCELK